MAQGWNIDAAAQTITFLEVVPMGAAIAVGQTGFTGYNQTDLWAFSAWNPGFGYPSEVEFFSDRLIFAGSVAQPQTLWMTKAGDYRNFGRTTPTIDSDGITMTINARQVNKIQELIPMKALIIMTTSCEVQLTTGADEVVAPGKVGFSYQSFYGSAKQSASVVGETALFVQGRGSVIRDLGYQFTKDGYTGNDLTVYASHLLEGYTIVDMAFQQVPYSCVWIVRSDGALISITYLKEQEVVGWALHTTSGLFKTVCTIPEGAENAVYVGVVRTIQGIAVSMVEKLSPRLVTDVRDAFFVDAGLTFDGRKQAGTARLTGGITWLESEVLTLATSSFVWSTTASDNGDRVMLYIDTTDVNGVVTTVQLPVVITSGAGEPTGQRTVMAIGTVPAAFRNTYITRWDVLRNTISGLTHLEGRTVSVLADGSVQKQKVVASGAIVLDVPAAVVQVGLPYRSDIESLEINAPGQETIRDRPKLIGKVSMIVKDTRGLKAGPDTARLEDIKTEFSTFDSLPELFTGLVEYTTSADWNKSARFVAVQDDPLPATVLGLIPHLAVGGG